MLARVAGRAGKHIITKRLVHTIALTPTATGIDKWNKLVDSDQRHDVRHTIINSTPFPTYTPMLYTGPVPEFDSFADWDGDPDNCSDSEYANFYTSLGKLSQLPRMDSVCLRFTENCAAEDDVYGNRHEPPSHRFEIFEQFFQVLAQRRQTPGALPVRTLTIYNLQNMPSPQITSSTPFTSVMRDVQHLHLHIREEWNEHGPDQDIEREERRTFMPFLRDHWLAPIASQLKSLTISFPDCWGPLPGYFCGHGLHFPKLENLVLGRYCLAHGDSMDWVLRQESLKSLRLHNCMIASHLRVHRDWMSEWQVKKHDWTRLPSAAFGFEPEIDETYHYPGKWEDVFECIGKELRKLTDFRFHIYRPRSQDEDVPFDRPDRLTTTLSPLRYVVFDQGLLPTPWIDVDNEEGNMNFGDNDKGTPKLNRHLDTIQEDGAALDALCATVFERRQAEGYIRHSDIYD